MYHELTAEAIATRRKRQRIFIGIVVAIIVIVAAVTIFARTAIREQGALSVRDSILSSAKQCCAIEGSYPPSLEYLEKNYGLVINHDDYLINYETYAANVLPSVVVMPR